MDIKDKILDFLKKQDSLKTINEIAKGIGSNWYYVRSELKDLERDNKVQIEVLGRITYCKCLK